MTTSFSLNTTSLIFREISISDLDSIHAYASDPEVVRFQAWGPNTLGQTKEFVAIVIKEQVESDRRTFNLGVVERSTNTLIGAISASANVDGVHVGFSLNQAYWGKGYGRECASAVVQLAKEAFPQMRIVVPVTRVISRQ